MDIEMDKITELPVIPKQELTSEPLKGHSLDSALESLRSNLGLNPITVNGLLQIEAARTPNLSKKDKAVPAALMAGYIATFAATRLVGGEFMPVEVPTLLHEVL